MSRATRSRTSAPATWMAGSVIPKSEKSHWPTSANPARMPTATKQATLAILSRWVMLLCAVMARNAGTVAMGSTMTKRELNARTPYSNRVMQSPSLGGVEEFCAGIGMFLLGEPLVESAFFLSHDCRHDDLQSEEKISMPPSGRG